MSNGAATGQPDGLSSTESQKGRRMSLTRFAATRYEIRSALASFAPPAPFDAIYLPESNMFGGPNLHRATSLEIGRDTADIRIFIVPLGQAVPTRAVMTESDDRPRFALLPRRQPNPTGYILDFGVVDRVVNLYIGAEDDNRIIRESQICLNDPFNGSYILYRALARHLTNGFELIDDLLVSPGALRCLSNGGVIGCQSDPIGNGAYGWDYVVSERERTKWQVDTFPSTRLSVAESVARIRTMGWLDELSAEEGTSEAESFEAIGDGATDFEFFRTNVYGQDFRRLTIPNTYIGKSALELVRFDESDLAGSTIEESDVFDCSFACSVLIRSQLAALFIGCNFTSANLDGADLANATLVDCQFDGASLVGATLTRGIHDSVQLTAAQHASANWVAPDSTQWTNG